MTKKNAPVGAGAGNADSVGTVSTPNVIQTAAVVQLDNYISIFDPDYIPQPRPTLRLTPAYSGERNTWKLRELRERIRCAVWGLNQGCPIPGPMPYAHDGYGFPSGTVRAFYISDDAFRAQWQATHKRVAS